MRQTTPGTLKVKYCRECRQNTLWEAEGCRMRGSHVDWRAVTDAFFPDLRRGS